MIGKLECTLVWNWLCFHDCLSCPIRPRFREGRARVYADGIFEWRARVPSIDGYVE